MCTCHALPIEWQQLVRCPALVSVSSTVDSTRIRACRSAERAERAARNAIVRILIAGRIVCHSASRACSSSDATVMRISDAFAQLVAICRQAALSPSPRVENYAATAAPHHTPHCVAFCLAVCFALQQVLEGPEVLEGLWSIGCALRVPSSWRAVGQWHRTGAHGTARHRSSALQHLLTVEPTSRLLGVSGTVRQRAP